MAGPIDGSPRSCDDPGVEFVFCPLARADFDLLGRWLARPHVHAWWHHKWTPEALEVDFGDGIDSGRTEYFVVSQGGRPTGFVQRYCIGEYPEWVDDLRRADPSPETAAGIDYFIGELDVVGHGVGTAMLRAFLADTWRRYPHVDHLLVDVDPANPASWRALEKNGFAKTWEGVLESDDEPSVSWVFRLRRPV